MHSLEDFDSCFGALTGNSPFPWQRRLYDEFTQMRFPTTCNIPTGLGKTSVIAIWLLALARHSSNGSATCFPRRLVYVVNRRTVVDQSTTEAERMRDALTKPALAAVTTSLGSLGIQPCSSPLAISTLRGQFADNGEWRHDPARPGIVVGTVDMVGSRLLFSGYGCGFKSRPLHAGFLGQDTLLVHDEAHLEPAFQELLVAIEGEQQRCHEFRQFRAMALSATSRNGGEELGLSDTDRGHPVLSQRIQAKKRIELHPISDEKKTADKVAELALDLKGKHPGSAILVFLHKLEDVEMVRGKLHEEDQAVQVLTGTLRGLERDALAREDDIFARFVPKPLVRPRAGPVYLVCTSAGEVGVDISADHMVCDLIPFDSMAQRFGRMNRFGVRDDTEIHIVHPTSLDGKNELDQRRDKTLGLLRQLKGDGSPRALSELGREDRLAAFSPPPTILPTSDILFDSWALTTIRGTLPGRPPVEPYLHGVSGWEPPETHVAWRAEVGAITDDLLREYDPSEMIEDYPLKPHELLRDRSVRVFAQLTALAERRPRDRAWLMHADGTVEALTVRDLADGDKKDRINHCTVLLPPQAGGLTTGMLDGRSESANDVADEWKDENGRRRRTRVWDDDDAFHQKTKGMRLIRIVDTKPDAGESDNGIDQAERRSWHWYELPRGADNDGSMASPERVLWRVHTDDVKERATRIVRSLALPDEIQHAVILAAASHDGGKRRELFQRILGNWRADLLLAKSDRPSRLRESYRHELGSLLDVESEIEFKMLGDDMKDMVLHLIAAHHGRARPHFPTGEVFDPEPRGKDIGTVASEVPRRFARLQRRYGRWGLAYLESLLRAADYAASADPSAVVEDD